MQASKRIWLLTGEPGVGKTTVLTKTVNLIKAQGYTVGGVVSREVRSRGIRLGFELMDMSSERRGTLASSALNIGPRIGRYRVNLHDLAEVGAKALLTGAERSDIVVCDEVGPMELYSSEFKRAVKVMVECGKPVVGTIHHRLRDPLIEELKSAPYAEVIEVNVENRADLPLVLAEKVLSKLKGG